MPSDGAIQIAFDRYLLPSTVTRQSVTLLDASNQPVSEALAPRVEYDPIARTVTLSNPSPPAAWLAFGISYKVALAIPTEASEAGLRAIDGATLDPNQERVIAFFVGGPQPRSNPTVRFCRDVLPIFAHKCATSGACHAADERAPFALAAGLDLQTSVGVENTAIERVAQGANTSAGIRFEETSRVFGINMPIVKRGDPGNSWLLYKVELAPPPIVDSGVNQRFVCGSVSPTEQRPTYAPLAPARLVADDLEREILSGYVPGREMPYPRRPFPVSSSEQPLTLEEREMLRMWIAQGAIVEACEGCAAVGP